jgi:tetratricopeptide (TPR) repeat protein
MRRSLLPYLGPALVLAVLLGFARASAAATFEEHVALGKASFRLATDQGDTSAFNQAHKDFLAAAQADPSNPLAHYYMALADWRVVREMVEESGDSVRIELLAGEAIEHCDRTLGLSPDHAEALAIRGSMFNALSTVRTADRLNLYSQADRNVRRACELSPGNPRVWLMAGMFHLDQPLTRGGGSEGALKEIRRALELFEHDNQSMITLSGGSPRVGRGRGIEPVAPPMEPDDDDTLAEVRRRPPIPLEPDWGHDEAWQWAGKAHMTNGQFDAARRCFLRALEINPSNGEVRNELLPECEEALTQGGDPSS